MKREACFEVQFGDTDCSIPNYTWNRKIIRYLMPVPSQCKQPVTHKYIKIFHTTLLSDIPYITYLLTVYTYTRRLST